MFVFLLTVNDLEVSQAGFDAAGDGCVELWAASERTRHTYDSQGQILALARR